MNRLTRGALLLAITGGMLAPVAPASAGAEPAGGLLVIPGAGNDVTPIRLRTSAGCPAAANAFYATMKGRGFPAEGQIVTANTKAGMSRSMGFDAYVALVMRDYGRDNHAPLGGRYDITVFCIDRLTRHSYRDFTGSLEFITPTDFRAIGSAAPIGPPPPPLALASDGSALAADPSVPAGQAPSLARPQPPAGVEPQPAASAEPESPLVVERPAVQHDDGTGRHLRWLVPLVLGVALGALVLTALIVTAVARRIRQGSSS